MRKGSSKTRRSTAGMPPRAPKRQCSQRREKRSTLNRVGLAIGAASSPLMALAAAIFPRQSIEQPIYAFALFGVGVVGTVVSAILHRK